MEDAMSSSSMGGGGGSVVDDNMSDEPSSTSVSQMLSSASSLVKSTNKRVRRGIKRMVMAVWNTSPLSRDYPATKWRREMKAAQEERERAILEARKIQEEARRVESERRVEAAAERKARFAELRERVEVDVMKKHENAIHHAISTWSFAWNVYVWAR